MGTAQFFELWGLKVIHYFSSHSPCIPDSLPLQVHSKLISQIYAYIYFFFLWLSSDFKRNNQVVLQESVSLNNV